jgi:hypothetical protein
MFPATALSASWGDLQGQFIYNGTPPTPKPLTITKDAEVCGVKEKLFDESLVVGPKGELANVVIYVRTTKVEVHPDYQKNAAAKIVLDNKGCRFEPHVLALLVTQPVTLKNSDTVPHNTNIQPIGDAGTNPLIAAGGSNEYKFNRKQNIPVPVGCNIHPWMNAHVLPRDNPYFAVSDKDGKFTIKNLPVGELDFQVWHEKSGYLATGSWTRGQFKLKIAAGTNELGDNGVVKVDAKLFKKN